MQQKKSGLQARRDFLCLAQVGRCRKATLRGFIMQEMGTKDRGQDLTHQLNQPRLFSSKLLLLYLLIKVYQKRKTNKRTPEIDPYPVSHSTINSMWKRIWSKCLPCALPLLQAGALSQPLTLIWSFLIWCCSPPPQKLSLLLKKHSKMCIPPVINSTDNTVDEELHLFYCRLAWSLSHVYVGCFSKGVF